MDIETLWYFVIALSLLFYVTLDGFDLGVGAFHLLARTDEQRRIFLNSIGPVWDGNEVWVVIVIGGLFAGFPDAYASVLSGFYTMLMIFLAALIFRAAAIEFRSKEESRKWRMLWDTVFSFASILVAFILGLLLGNLIEGVEIDSNQNISGTFFRPYSILVGITAISLFAMHGAIYLSMKTEGETHQLVKRWIFPAIAVFLFCYLVTTIVTVIYLPQMTNFLQEMPALALIPMLACVAIVNVVIQVKIGNDGWAFVFSCASIALLLSLFACGTYPHLVRATIPANSLTIYNTAATHKTIGILLTIVAIGLPLVFAYGYWVYRTFRGKVKLDSHSY